MRKGRLFLIPVPLGASTLESVLPASLIERAKTLTHYIAENAKSARAFLKILPHDLPLQQIDIRELSEHTRQETLPELLQPLMSGIDVGLVSEAGCPAVADPGSALVALAHEQGIEIEPMVGPSSILLALMGSGLSGQNFAFHGYLPAKEDERQRRIRQLEKESRQGNQAQIFIETPYRNRQMLETLLKSCAPQTRICLAIDLTLASQHIEMQSVAAWQRGTLPEIDRRPTVFLLQA